VQATNNTSSEFEQILQAVHRRKDTGKLNRRKSTASNAKDNNVNIAERSKQVCDKPTVSSDSPVVSVTKDSFVKDNSANFSEESKQAGDKPSVLSEPEISITEDSASITNSEIDNIIVIDNIDDPPRFASSRSILKEVNKHCSRVKVEFAYSLCKGGVAIHTPTKKD